MQRDLARDSGLRVGKVREAFRLQQATQTRLVASIGVGLSRIPLIDFNARGPEPSRGQGRGVSYRKSGVTQRLADAFIATMGSGHRGVFRRVGALGRGQQGPSASRKKSRGAWSPNLPIVELRGPSLGHIFRKYRPAGVQVVNEALVKNLGHELDWVQQKREGAGGTAD